MDVLVIMTEEIYYSIPYETRLKFSHVEKREENEYEANKEDKGYMELYKKQKKAKSELTAYLFDKRHNRNE